MPISGGTAVVELVANGAKLSGQIAASVEQGTTRASSAISAAGAKITSLLTNPLVLAGAVAAKLGFDFTEAFTKVAAVTDTATGSVTQLKDQVLSLSKQTAQSPRELADAFYFLASAGLKAGQPMEVLQASAKASAVGLGDTADVARLTANVLNAYAKSGITATQVTDDLVAAVREGTANTDEFTTAIGRVLPIASRASVGFDQIVASLAALSNIGLDVNEGVTALRGLLQSIVAPTTQTQKALKALGITTDQLRSTLSEQGLPGALKLLETRSHGNIDVLRELIPNIRALTGELGLTGENAGKVADIFDAVANSAGSLNRAWAITQQSPAFQFRKALNEIVVVGTKLGAQILPVVTGVLKELVPPLTLAARYARALLVAFLAYKAVTFLPTLLVKLGTALQAVSAQAAASAVATRGVGLAMGGLGPVAAVAAVSVGVIVGALDDLHRSNEAARQSTTSLVDSLTQKLREGAISATSFKTQMTALFGSIPGWARETLGLAGSQQQFNSDVNETIYALQRQAIAEGQTVEQTKVLSHFHRQAGEEIKNFAGLTTKALKEFRKTSIDSMTAVAGTVADTGAVWTLAANEAVKGVQRMAAAQQRLARDIAQLDKVKVGDNFKKFLIEQGPQAIDAFIQGTKSQRRQFEAAFKTYETAARNTTKGIKDVTTTGGQQAGKGLADGVVAGIHSGSGPVIAAAHQLGLDTVAALKAAMGVKSPSTEGVKVGVALVDGIIKGLDKQTPKLVTALQDFVKVIRKNLGEGAADQAQGFLDDFNQIQSRVNALGRQFDQLKSKIRDFRSAITGAFSQFADLLGPIGQALADFKTATADFAAGGGVGVAPAAPDLHAMVAAQVAGAVQLAKDLAKLQAAGLNKALLAQLAQQGANAIPIAEQLLGDPALIQQLNDAQKQIADVTQDTATKLVNAKFGEQVQAMAAQVEHVNARFDTLLGRLQDFVAAIPVPELKDETRDFIAALRHMTNFLQNLGGSAPTAPPGGGGANPSANPAGVTVHVTINGDVTGEDVARHVESTLVRKLSRQGAIFNGAVRQ